MKSSKTILHKLLPAIGALAIFLVVSLAYFSPQLQGEVLPQHDVVQYEGMSKDINDQRAATGEDPQWTGGMFSGMPAYLINVAYPAQLVKNTVGKVVKLIDTPAGFLFFAMTAFWLMLLMCGVDPWVGIVPALAYGLSTYFILIIGAGHITKMWALVYAPLMMGGMTMTLRGDMWMGAAVTALAAALEIGANHPQITYYFLLAMGAFWISEAVVAIRKKHLRDFGLRTAVLAAAGLLAVGANFSPLWYTAQHSKETIRGGSELAAAAQTPQNGLDLGYATAWSYGRVESINMLVPDFMGRDSGTPFPAEGEVAAALGEYSPALRGMAQQLPAYWGDQPYTGGPTYLGAAAIFLAVMGVILARGRNKWWIVAVCAVMLLLSWGRNAMWFTEFAFKYLPGYNKFRTVSMAQVVIQWAVPLLGALALVRLWKDDLTRKQLMRALAWAAGVTGGVCLLLAVAGGSMFDFGREQSQEMMTEQFHYMLDASDMQAEIDQGMDIEMGLAVGDAMADERAAMMRADAWRSLLMIMLAAGAVALFATRRINKYVLTAILGAVMLIDLVPVDLRFLSHDNFISARRRQITATAADKAIMADKELGFRVLNLTVSPFNDATTSYFHRSVGGYHGAKLSRYQDIIDRYLDHPYIDGEGRERVYRDEGVLDMLNTRYLIVKGADGQPEAVRRTTANGPAWFVQNVVRAATPQQEIDLIGEVDLKTTAVIAGDAAATADTTATISLAEYRPNYLRYEYTSERGGLAVFSEIYYDKGWTATIDGAQAPYLRADYVLRAMELPAGEHTVEWRFRAPHWTAVEAVTMICSLAILLGGVAAAVWYIIRKRKVNENERRQEA